MRLSIILFLLVIAVGCENEMPFDPSRVAMEWELVKNNHDGKGNFLAALTLVNKSRGDMPSSGWKLYFSLRYHTVGLASLNSELSVDHVNGELFTITPTRSMSSVPAGGSVRIEFTGARRIANFQDVPSGFFWVDDDTPDFPVALANPFVKREAGGEKLIPPYTGNYAANASVINIVDTDLMKVLPTPLQYKPGHGEFVINNETIIVTEKEFEQEAKYLVDEIEKLTRFRIAIDEDPDPTNVIRIKRKAGPPESYTLSVTGNNGCTIAAADAAGVFYGIQSLKQLFPVNSWSFVTSVITIGAVEVSDRPRFPFRAFMIDVARNFEPKKNVLRLLEVMSLYKLNTFHFHLNDDEGWRLEIPDLPELTDVGAVRGYPFADNQRLQPSYGSGPTEKNYFGTGHYSRADFIEILKYATQRHIRVIPEVESPGHARAAIRSMEARYNRLMKEGKKDEATQYLLHDVNDTSKYLSAQYFTDNVMDASLPSTYNFIDKVIGEIKEMYDEAGAPLTLFHMGGDEVPHGAWEQSPSVKDLMKKDPSIKKPSDLYAAFFAKTVVILEKYGLKMTGWQEMITEHSPEDGESIVVNNKKYHDDDLQFDAWWDIYGAKDKAYEIANAGYKTVLTCFDYYYFDLAQAPSFDEPGDAWIGYLGLQKTFSFIPYDVYNSYPLDFQLNVIDTGRFTDRPRLSALGRKSIIGLQAALWAENMTYDGYMEYQVLPRLLALAERAWAPDPAWSTETGAKRAEDFNRDWSSFANRLGKRELPRLDHYNGGYSYRLPTPSLEKRGKKLNVNSELPGIVIRYTLDESEPLETSPVYFETLEMNGPARLRAFSTTGRGGAVVEASPPYE
jgi:hexosaminidase